MNNCVYLLYPAKKAVSPKPGRHGENVRQVCGGCPEKMSGVYDAVVETIKFWKEELEKRCENFRGGMNS